MDAFDAIFTGHEFGGHEYALAIDIVVAFGAFGCCRGFLSATQDIAFDAYSTDVLHKEERGAGAAVKVLGYRMAMLASGGLALVMADSWLG